MATLPTGVYLRPGSSVFHLRIGVPKDLQQHFRNPKTGKPKADAFRASLRTSNRAEAGTRAHEIIAEWQRRFTADAGTVKTQESERIVPLASHLLSDPWFAAWLAGVMGGTGPAMPSACGRTRGPGDTLGQWFRQFRAAASLPQGKLEGSHKFRHWLRTALAEKHVGEATMDSITGHSAQGSSGRKNYTASASLSTMKEALDRVE
ncbi:hypothetical protein DF122_37235 [Burkholderia pseudomallei]|nr:hypothetical protein DF122_37235 [Burkholderia pseudomallei]